MRAIVWVLIAAMITTFYVPIKSYAAYTFTSIGTATVGQEITNINSVQIGFPNNNPNWQYILCDSADPSHTISNPNDYMGMNIQTEIHVFPEAYIPPDGTVTITGTPTGPCTIYIFKKTNTGEIDENDVRTFTVTAGAPGPAGGGGVVALAGASSAKAEDADKGVYIPPCDHSYEWQTITAATATADGEEAYMCTKCGDVKERRGLSAMGVFEVEFANKILKAGPGATVYIDCKPWNSFGWAIRDAMKKRPDVTIKASFLSEGYKGTPLKVTIPAARTDLFDNNGYLGLCRAGTALGYDQ